MNKKDIAVVGMSCHFHACPDTRSYWEQLCQGKEMLQFFSQKELESMDIPAADEKDFIGVQSSIGDKGSFDYAFFGYTRAEASVMDPQIRLFHEHAWKALEDAGCDPYRFTGKIGIFAGASEHVNWMAHVLAEGGNRDVDPFVVSQLANKSFLPTLTAYKLHCNGPAYYIDTACSTSLSVIHLASRSLLMKECSLAIAGAVRIDTTGKAGYQYRPGTILSADGHCRPFDAASSGTVPGEGIGVVALRRVEDAIANGDHIYAVIRSSAVNNDGSRKVGYAAPGADAQAECIQLAHRIADVPSSTITYVEAHGTATRLGDPIEIEALNKAFGYNKEKHCTLGAVKSNMGHLDTAAGMAGFIKTVLALYHKQLPPTLHFHEPNAGLDLANGPFSLSNTLQKWPPNTAHPRRAGISSFGIGGTNVHLVLEEAPDIPARNEEPPIYLLPFAARTQTSLAAQLAQQYAFIDRERLTSLASIAYTLQTRRRHFNHRQYAIGKDRTALLQDLAEKKAPSQGTPQRPALVFMFPGQGAQYRHMAKGLYQQNTYFRQWVDQGFTDLYALTGINYHEILFHEETPLTADRITDTRYVQPLLFVVEYALARLVMHWGLQPDYTIGHSIGEITAACLSGVISFSDALILVNERAAAMSAMPAGKMISIGQPASVIQTMLEKDTCLAAVNAPDLCVAAGTFAAIDELLQRLTDRSITATTLRTSHAFHSPLMDPAVSIFRDKLKDISFSEPQLPFISNVSGAIAGSEVTNPAYWASQLRNTVLFHEGIQTLTDRGPALFLELGPGNTLTTFVRQIVRTTANGHHAINLLRHPMEHIDDYTLFLQRIGEAWTQGFDLDWHKLYDSPVRPVPLPLYPFNRTDLPAIVQPFTKLHAAAIPPGKNRDISQWFYLPGWTDTILPQAAISPANCLLLFSDNGALACSIAETCTARGIAVITLHKGSSFRRLTDNGFSVAPYDPDSYRQLWQQLAAEQQLPDSILYSWGPDDAGDLRALIALCRGCGMHDLKGMTLRVVTSGVFDRGTTTLTGFLKVLALEIPAIFCGHLDIDEESNVEIASDQIINELQHNSQDETVWLTANRRLVRAYTRIYAGDNDKPSRLKKQGIYVITGGAGRLGRCLATYLSEKYQAQVILTGRRVQTDDAIALQAGQGTVVYHSADVADIRQLENLITDIEHTYGPINGVIHAAADLGQVNFKPADGIDAAIINAQFNAKVKGIRHLYTLFEHRKPDFIWLASSLSAILGGLGYAAYAAANGYMDHFARAAAKAGHPWISVDLDGLLLDTDALSPSGISAEELVKVFEKSLTVTHAGNLAISVSDLFKRLRRRTLLSDSAQTKDYVPQPGTAARQDDFLRQNVPVGNDGTTTGILTAIWKEFFGLADIGPEDDFFQLGGDSLRAMTLSRRIHQQFNVELNIETFFRKTTILAMAAEIDIILAVRQLQPDLHAGPAVGELKI